MADARMMWVAQRAAELLPEAPGAHDCFGYLAWEELVLATARRMEPFLALTALPGTAGLPTLHLDADSGRLDASSLIVLGVMLARGPEATATTSCEALLHRAVDAARVEHSSSVTA